MTAAPAELRPLPHTGPFRGLGGLTLAEIRRWVPARSLGLTVAGVAVMAAVYGLYRLLTAASGESGLGAFVYLFMAFWAIVLTLTVAAGAQGAVAGEIDDGTAAWLIGMPVSRSAFVPSKVLGAVPGLILAVGLPGLVGYALIRHVASIETTAFSLDQLLEAADSIVGESIYLPPPGFGEYAGLLVRMIWFELFLVALLALIGTFFRSRSAVLGLGLVVAIAMLLLGLLRAQDVLGVNLDYVPAGLLSGSLEVLTDEGATLLVPLITTTVWIGLLTALGTARFARKEL